MKRFIILLVAMLFTVPARGESISIFGRSGEIVLSEFGSPNWRISATDTDESVQTALLGEVPPFDERFVELDGNIITREPHDLDAGDWAYAVGFFDGAGDPQLFFQIRLAGSNATVLDNSLGAEFVDAGLWTGIDDYIEFDPRLASYDAFFQSPRSVPNGPDSYNGFIFPEPSSFVLALLALFGAVATFRRNRKR